MLSKSEARGRAHRRAEERPEVRSRESRTWNSAARSATSRISSVLLPDRADEERGEVKAVKAACGGGLGSGKQTHS